MVIRVLSRYSVCNFQRRNLPVLLVIDIFLGKEYCNKLGKLNKKKMIAEARELFEELGVDIDPAELVENLNRSEETGFRREG